MRKADVFRPYRPYIVDAPTAAYLLCMSVSAFHEYVKLGFLPNRTPILAIFSGGVGIRS